MINDLVLLLAIAAAPCGLYLLIELFISRCEKVRDPFLTISRPLDTLEETPTKGDTMLISKETIMTAIDQECLLAAGAFGNYIDPKCEVCAVGAVLRQVVKSEAGGQVRSDALIDNAVKGCYTSDDYDVKFLVAPPLGQISAAFEFAYEACLMDGFPESAAIEIARMHALFIAEAFCPDWVTIELNPRSEAF